MANSTTTNPIMLDTFSADVTIAEPGKPLTVKAIVFWSTNADDKLVMEDCLGVTNVWLQLATAKDTIVWTPAGDGFTFNNGLIMDVSDGAYNTASRCLIYIA